MQPSHLPPDIPDNSPLILAYNALIQNGELVDDTAQRHVLLELDAIRQRLLAEDTQSSSLLEKLFSSSDAQPAPKGLYIWGGVGRGKSMLMDLFYQHIPIEHKRRIHFHAFMQEVHNQIHALRQSNTDGADPVLVLARQMASSIRLLCFDELQADDVADATLLYRLFGGLWDHGLTIVSTSNHPPQSLYTGGIQKERFDKFIGLINERMDIAPLTSDQDYRTQKEESSQRRYFFPLGPAADQFIRDTLELWGNPAPKREILEIKGRSLRFSLYGEDIGRFSFAELCEKPLGAADYAAIATRCNKIILTDIPQLSPAMRNEAKRFVTLIDTLYEHKTLVLFTAAAEPDRLYPEGDGAFEFKRTVSRLLEMQSEDWGART